MAQPRRWRGRSAKSVDTTVPVVRVSVGRAFLVGEIAKRTRGRVLFADHSSVAGSVHLAYDS